jgi:hypothetical protein
MPKTDKGAEGYLKLLFWNAVVNTDSGPGPDVYDNFGTGGTALLKSTTPGFLCLSLHTAAPTGSSQSSNEISYTGYNPGSVRLSVARAAAQWTYSTPSDGGGQVVNAVAQTFGKMTGGTGGIARFWGIGTDVTGAGTLLYYGPLALEIAKPYTVTDLPSDATLTNNDIICNQSYAAGDQVCFIDVPGAAVPAGLTADTYYFVIAAGLNTEKFRVSTTAGGSAVDITGEGSGYVAKVLEKSVALNDEPKIDIGAMVILER